MREIQKKVLFVAMLYVKTTEDGSSIYRGQFSFQFVVISMRKLLVSQHHRETKLEDAS